MTANIITLCGSVARHTLIVNELATQKIKSARFWYGEVAQWNIQNGIARAHKQIVRDYAYQRPDELCWILEDDVKFSSPGAADYYLKNIPSDFDLYLGCISDGNIDGNDITDNFSGFLCVIVHPRFFSTYLQASEQENIDRWMTIYDAGKVTPRGKFVVSNPFVCTSHETYSEHHKQVVSYAEKFKGRPLFNGK